MDDKKSIQDYKDYYSAVCRTCLQSSGEMQNLNAPVSGGGGAAAASADRSTFMDCLNYCMPSYNGQAVVAADELDALPTRICKDCASALQVAYWFMKNAIKAQEVLKIRINEMKEKQKELEREEAAQAKALCEEVKKPKRYRCKICNTKLETKRSLKDHVKLHLDIIAYNCQLCGFEHHQRTQLIQHYQLTHGVEPTPEQLKPKTKITPPNNSSNTTSSSSISSTVTRHSASDNRQQFSQQTLTNAGEVFVENLPAAAAQNTHEIIYTSAPQNQNIVYATAINTQTTPLEGNPAATTIFAQPNGEAFTFNSNFDGNLNVQNNDANVVGNEYIVMADGSVENVMGKGVVIEYINAGENNDNASNNLSLAQTDAATTNMVISQNDMVQMDVDDLIVEDPENTPEQTQDVPISPIDEDMIPATFIEQPKRNICKICAKEFDTQDALKNHMLTHNEIPHFFCDHCSFYTFFKIDLNQHYKSKHNIQPTNKQLQPKNKPTPTTTATTTKLVYGCDICFYECDLKYEIKRHYQAKHRMNVQDIQQRPTRTGLTNNTIVQPISHTKVSSTVSVAASAAPSSSSSSSVTSTASSMTGSPAKTSKMNLNNSLNNNTTEEDAMLPDYLNGLNCRKCNEVFFYRNKLYEHYKLHSAQEEAAKQQKQTTKMQKTVNNIQQQQQQQQELSQQLQEQTVAATATNHLHLTQNETHLAMPQQQQNLTQEPQIQLQYQEPVNQPQQPHLQVLQQLPQQEVVITTTPLDNSLTSSFNNVVDPMTLVLTPNTTLNNSVAPLTPSSSSTYTLPSDAIPQIVEMEQTIETDMDFDFNGDALFEDFDDVENSSDDNDMRNLALTSDDDFDDVLKEQSESQTETATSYCAQCQKSFLSQYQFENHMFLHRGLAPYRCEMCTNLYNTKRALIRHYRAVHKRIPTRDMIQAKGDKVYVCDNTTMDYLSIEKSTGSTVTTFMCAKCTYESTDFPSVQLHLNTNHSIHDDSYILRKLPYECPRCIRSFSTKAKLLRHMERNHSTTPINNPQIQINSTETATTTTTTTTAPALNNNHNHNENNNTAVDPTTATAATSTMQQVINNNNNNNSATSGLVDDCNSEPQLFDIGSAGQINDDDDGDETKINDRLSFEQCGVTPTSSSSSSSSATSFVMLCPDLQSDLTIDTVPPPTATSVADDDTNITPTKDIEIFNNNDILAVSTELPSDSMPDISLEPEVSTNELDNTNNNNNDTPLMETAKAPNENESETATKVLYKCLACLENCTTIEAVRLHSRKVTCREQIKAMHKGETSSSGLYKCEVCGDIKYPTLYLLRHHLKKHIARTFRCTCCPKSYLSKFELDTHQRSHTDERPHQCDKCPNSFRYAHHLKRHKDIIHFGKRYMCPEANCNRQFTTMDQLKIHKWSHCGIVPHKCKHCGQLFKKRLFLRNHCSKFHNKPLTDDEEFSGSNLTCKSPQEDILQPINWD
ncbi:zinc finger protein 236-like [Musca vetustissima]|uniref:zinc finger protein 236-like n=1 Tax=Musca vetustissima TaxID=27455 RepID=UPI002AB67B7A|nr:zinc finger protein 236-like [Musca vetustissima]